MMQTGFLHKSQVEAIERSFVARVDPLVHKAECRVEVKVPFWVPCIYRAVKCAGLLLRKQAE